MRVIFQETVFVLVLILGCHADHQQYPNECERGVKRHHPSQANVYQVFTRHNFKKQWLDYTCPDLMIFDPKQCECVEAEKPVPELRPLPNKDRRQRPEPPRTPDPQYEYEENKRSDYRPDPKPAWPQQPQQPQQSQQAQKPSNDWTRRPSAKDNNDWTGRPPVKDNNGWTGRPPAKDNNNGQFQYDQKYVYQDYQERYNYGSSHAYSLLSEKLQQPCNA